MPAEVTMLSFMAGKDFAQALDQHVAWDVRYVDLKDSIFGKGILDLTDEEAKRAAAMIAERKLSTYCLSTTLFHDDIEKEQEHFANQHLGKVARAIEMADIFKPVYIRLIAASTITRSRLNNSMLYVAREAPWLFDYYRQAIERIGIAGFKTAIENETGNCIFAQPNEVIDFFTHIGNPKTACFTWDVQNLWQLGTYPTLDIYKILKPVMGYYHLKGGHHDPADKTRRIRWASALDDAHWPVTEITRQVVADGTSPVICLNPSHGAPKAGYDYEKLTERDLNFVRQIGAVR